MNLSDFWAHVAIPDCPDDEAIARCWLWTAARTGSGYGCLQYAGRQVYAHRLAYELTHGELLPGQEVRHLCHNPLCCNPAHLASGSHADNMQDMARAGRVRRGVNREWAGLIRSTDIPAPLLAAALGCTPTAIYMIRRGESYPEVAA